MFERRLKLGTFFGIGLYVHWTFALLIGFVALSEQDDGSAAIAFHILLLLGVFLCVTLHEYGHALAARRFGIPTIDITLLPIGGVARLQRMPRIAWQELVVAVAGPAVNVVIAAGLLVGLLAVGGGGVLKSIAGLSSEMSVMGFAITMLAINMMLVLFNMIPAFPMDGGRVLRSLLAMFTDYRTATFFASRIGLGCALLMAGVAIYFRTPIPVLISIFIAYAGMAEARQVDMMESVRGLRVGDCMVQYPTAIAMDTPLDEVAERWQAVPSSSLPVLAFSGLVVGVLNLKDVIAAIDAGTAINTTAGQLADHNVPFVRADSELQNVLLDTGGRHRQMPVVDEAGRLLGLLDLDSMLARGSIARHLAQLPQAVDRFDAVS
ncbi:site-2 protease family protein [Novipirellula artificiosorum]|uniref:Zinc metalloprotease n=1 Tax=Novipirellula artificiosorum TaxID=2528016 RepID=A0A5C6DX06_9BACT|nr:site-2 protease family protein [Novipirellula artificiosorum]TWU40744.1 putative zinc metalloprotease Rip3 [Novipirellula artificiosorum]